MEARYFDLLPEKDWEVDIDSIHAHADKNTVAVVIVSPGNPCGNVYSYEHLAKASLMVHGSAIADELLANNLNAKFLSMIF
jgi:aspartate/methionine/tyrosine aminotransferase